ncbi:hypothetical protein PDESU_06296 [Pontiella desulfatans]|uniref:Uncharacterized protein n=1 Tax=Pontiella desulfatans TaxID=2750659 RepID=A0A6C2UE97_PONDE|nr:hypothetical protein [Pontiella desulfatans]VGO17694.1 hypothetical protein PDESU_06296 [Pontiella desulfatans]
MKIRWKVYLAIMISVSAAHAATWDGSELDGLWTNELNWAGDALPTDGETIDISTGDTVSGEGLSGQVLPNGSTVNLSGNSTLTQPGGAIRMNGSTLNVASGSGLTGNGFWDLSGATLNFEDGAIATMADWEQKGNNTFKFELSASGFTKLEPGNLRLGGGATMANATYIADLQNYSGGTGTVTLVDFANDFAGVTAESFSDSTRYVTNSGVFTNSTITFDVLNDAIVLNILDVLPPVIPPVTWDNESGDGSWTTASNWDPDGLPTLADDVLVGTGGVVTNGRKEFAFLEIKNGASVTFSENLEPGNVISNAGTVDVDGVWRLQGSEVNLAGTGTLGANLTFLDTSDGTLNFEDGASFNNTGMAVELKASPTFGFKLSETGFATVQAGELLNAGSGSTTTTWENVTFEIDATDYDLSNGKTLVLMDFTNVAWKGSDEIFDPTVTVEGGVGTMAFDEVEHQVVLSLFDVVVWDDGGSGSSFSTAENWVGDVAPVSGSQSVAFKSSISSVTAYFLSEFTIGSNQVMLSEGNFVPMRIGDGADLTIQSGGVLDFTSGGNGILAQSGAGDVANVSLEGQAAASVHFYYPQTNWTHTFTPNASGIGTFEVKQQLVLEGNLVVDVSNYDPANGTDLVLFDYGTLTGSGSFADVTVIGEDDYTLVYDYDIDGNGDLGIALIVPPALTAQGTPYTWLEDYDLVVSNEYEQADLEDTDLDGLLNWQEYRAGTNPTNSASVLEVNSVTEVGIDQYDVAWQSVAGKTYNVVSVNNLQYGSPVTNASNVVGVETETVTTVTVSSDATFFTVELAE